MDFPAECKSPIYTNTNTNTNTNSSANIEKYKDFPAGAPPSVCSLSDHRDLAPISQCEFSKQNKHDFSQVFTR